MLSGMGVTDGLGRALDHAIANHMLLPTAVMNAAGLDRNQIRKLCRDGVIERVVRGLYRVRGSRTPLQDVAACVMRHGGAVASHVSALFVHGLDVEPPRDAHFTMDSGTGATALGVLHRSPLPRCDVTARHRIPVTTVARSIVDAAEHLSVDELVAVLNEAVSRRMVIIDQIEEVAARIERAPGRIGSGRVRAVLAPWTDAIQPDSPAEAAAIRRVADFGLATPQTQFEILDGNGEFVARADMAWPEQMVLREYDSDRFHGPERIEADERRRQALEALGWRVGGIRRQDLGPSELAWLRQLQADLTSGHRAIAS